MKQKPQQTLEAQVDSTVKHLIETSDQKHHQYQDRVRSIAYTLGQSKLPAPGETDIRPHIEEITGYYEKERTNVLVALASGIQSILTKIGLSELLKQIAEKKDQAELASRQLNNTRYELNKIKIDRDVRADRFWRWVLWVITLLEATWLALVFSQAFQDNNLLVLVGAIAISVLLIQSVKIITLYFRDKPYKEIPLWIKIGAPIMIVCIVTSLGLLRFTSIQVTSEETIKTITYLNSPIVFIFLTSIPLVGTALIVYRYFLSEDELKRLREVNRLKDECGKEEQKLAGLNEEVKQLTTQRNDIAQARIKCRHAEDVLIKRFDGYLREAVGLFKTENLKHRPDAAYPACFSNPAPKLSEVVPMAPIDHNQENLLA